MAPTEGDTTIDVETDALAETLEKHPIRVGVLFGSRATETAGQHSDVDVAVEFAGSLSEEQRIQARVELLVDLTELLGTDDVDVVDLDAIRPAVGRSALDSGQVLVGERERVETLLARFERETTTRTHEERMREFDNILDRMSEYV